MKGLPLLHLQPQRCSGPGNISQIRLNLRLARSPKCSMNLCRQLSSRRLQPSPMGRLVIRTEVRWLPRPGLCGCERCGDHSDANRTRLDNSVSALIMDGSSKLDHLFLFQRTFVKAQALPSALRGCQRFRVQALCFGGVFRPKRELLFAPSDGVNEVCRDASAIPIDSGLWMLPGTG